jgi:flagellar biogenesis protein FliO
LWRTRRQQLSTLSALDHEKETTPRVGGVGQRNKKGQPIMPLIQLVEVLIVVGVLLWLINRFIPMQSSIKSILNGVVVIAVVLWLMNVFGLFHSLSHIRIGKG